METLHKAILYSVDTTACSVLTTVYLVAAVNGPSELQIPLKFLEEETPNTGFVEVFKYTFEAISEVTPNLLF